MATETLNNKIEVAWMKVREAQPPGSAGRREFQTRMIHLMADEFGTTIERVRQRVLKIERRENRPDIDEVRQRADHFEHLYNEASSGRCGHSGMLIGICKASICDCFEFPWVKPISKHSRLKLMACPRCDWTVQSQLELHYTDVEICQMYYEVVAEHASEHHPEMAVYIDEDGELTCQWE